MRFQRSQFQTLHLSSQWVKRKGLGVRDDVKGQWSMVNGLVDPSRFTPYASPTLFRRVTLYSSALLIAAALVLWSTSRAQAIAADATSSLSVAEQATQQSLVAALERSDVSAFVLAQRGLALLAVADRTPDASLYLQAAALKDPNYRDAALYAAAAELSLADAAWPHSQTRAVAHTKTARQFLEVARSADPIHAETFRLLNIAYNNLGQAALAADARHKAELFASVGKDS